MEDQIERIREKQKKICAFLDSEYPNSNAEESAEVGAALMNIVTFIKNNSGVKFLMIETEKAE